MANNMEFNNNVEESKGMMGYAQNLQARNRMNRFAYGSNSDEDTGFLEASIGNAQALLKQIEEIEKALGGADKVLKSMNKSQQRAYENSKADVDLLKRALTEVKNTGVLSQEELNQYVKDNAKISKEAVSTLQVLLDKLEKSNSKSTAKLKGDIDAIKSAITLTDTLNTRNQQRLNEMNEELKKTQDNLGKGLGKTLTSIGNTLKDFSNMFNLQTIAGNTSEQNARSKLAIRNSVSSQFGFTSNSQFENFKNTMNDSLKDMNKSMNSIFNAEDLNNYMANLSKYGITDTKMAQDQMRNSLIGTKYLGTTSETMEMMFKYMKRTNNNKAIEDHNKTVAGLLQSSLDVSKEQLDALTQIAYGTEEDLKALGMTDVSFQAYNKANSVVGAALSSAGINGEAMQQLYADFLATGQSDASKWANLLGGNFQSMWERGFNVTSSTQSAQNMSEFFRALGKSPLFNQINGDGYTTFGEGMSSQYLNQLSGLTPQQINALKTLDFDELSNSISEGFDSISKANTESYVKETNEVTLLQKISNDLSTWFNGIDWKYTTKLANVAFLALTAGQIATFFSQIKNAGGISNIFKNFFGKSSLVGEMEGQVSMFTSGGGTAGKALGALGTGAAVVGLTAAAIAGISAAANAMTKSEHEAGSNNIQDNLNAQRGTRYEGDKGRAYTTGMNSKIGTGDSGWTYWKPSNFGKNFLGSAANGLVGWLNVFNKGDPVKYNTELWNNFQREIHGLYKDKELRDLEYTYALVLDNQGTFSVADKLFGIDGASLVNWISDEETSWEDIEWAARQLRKHSLNPVNSSGDEWNGILDNDFFKSWATKDGKNWANKYMTDGYHKAGLSKVPKDNYRALLHKGEMVLSADEAALYRDLFGIGGESDSTPRGKGRILTGLPWTMTAGWPSYPSGNQHRGLDFGIPIGTEVGAPFAGKVVAVERNKNGNGKAYGYGNYVRILGNNGKYFRFGHLSKPLVNVGDTVAAGTTIGLSGNTGNSTGPHVHFQVDSSSDYKSDINPYPYVTDGLFKTTGVVSPNTSSSIESNSSAVSALSSKRFISASLSSTGGIGGDNGSDKVVNSVDGGFNRLIEYLDNISKEQDSQRALLETYSINRANQSVFA